MNNGRKFHIAKTVLYSATALAVALVAFSLCLLDPSAALEAAMPLLLWWGGVSGGVLGMYGAINIVDKRSNGGKQ